MDLKVGQVLWLKVRYKTNVVASSYDKRRDFGIKQRLIE